MRVSNIEDMARDAGSFDAEEDVLDKLQVELAQLSSVDNNIYQPLHDMIQGITTWMGHRKDKLEKFEFELSCLLHSFYSWTGDNAIKELEAAGISQQCLPVLQQCAMKAIKIASDAEIDRVHLSGMSVATLDGLISALSNLFAGGGIHLIDYQLALQRYIKRESGSNASGWTHCFSLWCLNPSVVFRELADLSLSVILTSGTLSPMSSFASELGVQFEICMEAPHVINMESQLWAAVVSNGPDNVCLNASYKTADNYAFQDSLGASLEEICKVVPGGVLVFFPSYKLMDKLCCRWKQTGLWSRLCERKPVFVEPRGSSDDFESVLRGYYGSIRGMRKPVKLKGRNKRDFKHLVNDDSLQNDPKGEAALLAVCRGKVSEGIDFSDENARVIVGIPFPNKNDIKVVMKRRYNDKYRSSKKLLSGNEWYCQQAFRALNQASGRCIRHRYDYGAIILLDERFRGGNNVANMSKWLRKSIKEYDNFSMAINALEKFYPKAKEKVDEKYVNMKTAAIGDSLANEGHEKTTNNSGRGSQKKTTQKVKKICKGQQKQIASSDKLMPLGNCVLKKLSAAIKGSNLFYSPLRKEECNSPLVDSSRVKTKTIDGQKRDEMMGTSLRKASRSTVEDSGNSTGSDSKLSSDTEGEHVYHAMVEQDDNFPATAPTPSESPENLSHHSCGFMTPSGVSSKDALLPTVTPESMVGAEDVLNPEFESSLSHSVNSYHQKMRKPISLQLHRYMQMNVIGSIGDESVECTDSMSMHSSSQAKWRTGLAYQDGTSGIMSESFRESHPKVPDMQSLIAQPASCDFGELSERGEDCIRSMMSCLCCSVCDNPLGLAEEHFLVNCSFSSSSKYCLRSLMKTALVTGDSEESLVGSDPGLVPIIISDVNSIDCRVSRKRATVSAPNEDIWSEEDGCVFRPVYCPYCSMSNPCLGLQVMAADTSHIHLLEKILFIENRITARIHVAMSKEMLRKFQKLRTATISS
ncbi:Fanconi anemia group J protein-like protein [Nymphaea thermarum]|nr:Fanconi anemia group J protein-like protein [Nymphaea thermarum]